MSRAIDPADLAARLDDPAQVPRVLDVRAPDQFARWQIEGKAKPDTVNVPYWTALEDVEALGRDLPADVDVVVVCAYGGSSGMIVDMLDRPNVFNLAGGMDAWATTLVARPLLDDGRHAVVQLDRTAKACLSYAVAARGSTMAVIDPAASLEPYLALAAEMEATITDVFDTHLHADHISLGRALAASTGATYRLSPGDGEGAAFDFAPLRDGDVFTFGDVELVVRSVATPGHTPGSTSLEVAGRFLLTGDAVFVSGVGRPDLGGETEPWARDLFATIHERLGPLDPALEVCPAHYTSRGESGADGTLRRRLGDLLTNDPIVSLADEQQFVDYVVAHLGTPPTVYDEIRRVNLGLVEPGPDRERELEVGRNECALGG